MKTDLFDYELPEELIAFNPPKSRDGGRLLVLEAGCAEKGLVHSDIKSIKKHLPKGALLVLNDTRVIPARIYGKRPTGGQVEVLFIRAEESTESASDWIALARANRPLKPGDPLDLGGGIMAEVVERRDRGETLFRVRASEERLLVHMEAAGQVPLPPYIRREATDEDRTRYQTTYARFDGSVAAPTAGLHFSEELLAELKNEGFELGFVTLHVGPGTFRPIASDDLAEHRMDEEQYFISDELANRVARAKAEGRPVIAIGTTTVRALEGAAQANGKLEQGDGFTEIFITPGFRFQVVDGLVTNFHLPKSTLICLVSALAERSQVLDAYRSAVTERYRFYSYGDAMLILPRSR